MEKGRKEKEWSGERKTKKLGESKKHMHIYFSPHGLIIFHYLLIYIIIIIIMH